MWDTKCEVERLTEGGGGGTKQEGGCEILVEMQWRFAVVREV